MQKLVYIETDADLARDLSTNGIVNTNPNEYEKYLLQKKQKESEMTVINTMQEEIYSLKNDLIEIKKLIMGIVCNGN